MIIRLKAGNLELVNVRRDDSDVLRQVDRAEKVKAPDFCCRLKDLEPLDWKVQQSVRFDVFRRIPAHSQPLGARAPLILDRISVNSLCQLHQLTRLADV